MCNTIWLGWGVAGKRIDTGKNEKGRKINLRMKNTGSSVLLYTSIIDYSNILKEIRK